MLTLNVIGVILTQRRVSDIDQWYLDIYEDVGQLFHTHIEPEETGLDASLDNRSGTHSHCLSQGSINANRPLLMDFSGSSLC